MKVLLAGGTGFMGSHLIKSLIADNHQVWVLSRNPKNTIPGVQVVAWDGRTTSGWGHLVNEMDAVVNLCGLSTSNWPWTERKKEQFRASRVQPGLALASAIREASRRPGVFIQISGINHYGLRGEGIADEFTPPADDYLAQLTVAWEDATKSVEEVGVRRVVCRTAVVLARDAILLWLMALPVRLFVGGRFGSGKQAMPWIHIDDQIGGIRFLMENPDARGPYNLIAPQMTSNAEFMRTLAQVLQRPYWFPYPEFLMRLVLGEMSVLITEGRFSKPERLFEMGYNMHFSNLEEALRDIFEK
ncbi:MAG: TIGR01777 family oxidoreductase [Anaerolineales bacterium]|nr:TIGR01777 family oxidoreductase [Anaerolineales bacterium]